MPKLHVFLDHVPMGQREKTTHKTFASDAQKYVELNDEIRISKVLAFKLLPSVLQPVCHQGYPSPALYDTSL